MLNKYAKAEIAIRKMIIVAVLCLVGILSLALGTAAFGFQWNGEAAPNTENISGQLSGCKIPDDYSSVFNKAVIGYKVSPALIAAIFYAGEHYDSKKGSGTWPDINSTWAEGQPTSEGTAKGPFQFKDGTWTQYGLGGNVQDINDAAKGAANMFDKNIAAGKGDLEHNIKNAIKNYNSSDEYVNRVYNQFQTFEKCLNSGTGENKFSSLDQVKALYGSTPEEIKKHLSSTTFMGKDITVNEDMVSDLKKVEAAIQKTNYKVTTIGAYNFRANVNDPSEMSAHAFGLAIDINPTANPNADRPSGSADRDPSACKHDIPDQVVSAFENNNFFWGAKFKSICDPMHFQYGGNWN